MKGLKYVNMKGLKYVNMKGEIQTVLLLYFYF